MKLNGLFTCIFFEPAGRTGDVYAEVCLCSAMKNTFLPGAETAFRLEIILSKSYRYEYNTLLLINP